VAARAVCLATADLLEKEVAGMAEVAAAKEMVEAGVVAAADCKVERMAV